jgi:hypothetical protein
MVECACFFPRKSLPSKITPDTISITNTTNGRLPVVVSERHRICLAQDRVLQQGSIAGFKILYRVEHGFRGVVRWMVSVRSLRGGMDKGKAMRRLRRVVREKGD